MRTCVRARERECYLLRRAPDVALDVAKGAALNGLHDVLERVTVPVLAAEEYVVHEGGERGGEDLVGAALWARTLDQARRAISDWLDL